jgi:iron complex outermembrane receptor protein
MKIKSEWALLTAASLVVYCQNAAAQSTSSTSNAGSLEEIVVTAQKREQAIDKVGAPIVAITGASLTEHVIVSQADLANTIPGLSFSVSQYGTPVYTLRGAGFTDTSLSAYPDVTVYLDEIPLPFPVLAGLANFDLQRVEVLEGPQGTLFGANATGGAVNYIAAKPTSQYTSGVTLTYGRFNQLLADAYVSGPLSDTLKFRTAVRSNHADDWQYSYTRSYNNTTGRVSTLAGRSLLDWDPTDRVSFEFNVNGWRDQSDPQQSQAYRLQVQVPPTPAIELNYPLAPFDPRAADWDPDIPLYKDSWLLQTSLRGIYRVTDGISLTSLTSYIDAKYDVYQPGTSATSFAQAAGSQAGNFHDFFQELRLDNGGRSRTRWVVGLNYSKDDVTELVQSLPGEGSAQNTGLGVGIYGRFTTLTDNYAAFGNVEYDLVPSVTLKAGLRYTKTERDATSCTFDGHLGQAQALFQFVQDNLTAPPAAPRPLPVIGLNDCFTINPATGLAGLYVDALNQDNLSYRLGVDWEAADSLLLYFNYSKGYKAGGFPAALAATFQGYTPVRQESLIDYEAGFKAQLFDRRAFLTGSAFYYDYSNRQLHSKIKDVLGIFGYIDGVVNVPKSSVKGAELALSTKPVSGFIPTISATYLDATVDQFVGINDGGQAANYAGTRAPLTPKWSFNGDLKYQFAVSSSATGFVGASLAYKSSTNSLVGGSSDYDIDAYALVDVRAGVQSDDGKWNVMAFGKNILNKYYVTNAAREYDYVARFTGAPATFGVTVGYNF